MSNKKSYRKYAATTMAAAAAVAAVAPAAVSADETTKFTDVNENHNFYNEIMDLTEEGIITGFIDEGLFKPEDYIYRAQAMNMMVRALQLQAPNNVDEILKDITDVDGEHEYADNIAAVVEEGIFTGNETTGEITPWKHINREQMASVLVRAFDLNKYEADHVDINLKGVSDTHEANVQKLADLGITREAALEDFKPAANISRGQFAAQVHRTLEYIKEAEEGVAPQIESVSAITSNSVKVTLSGNASDLTAKDFHIKGDGLSVVKVDQKGKTATVEFNKDMTDGAEYTLQLVDEEMDVLSEGTFKYDLGEVASIALTKTSFEKGEKLTDHLKVLDDKGVEVSSANYNVVDVQSSNTDVVGNDAKGTVKDEGTANVRFKVEYKDGSFEWSDFITVNVESAVVEELAGYHLNTDSATDAYPNTVAYLNQEDADGNPKASKTILTESDAADHYLEVYADDSKGNPMDRALDLGTNGDYEVKSLDSSVATIDQDTNGVKLNYVSPGDAKILITGKDGFKKTVTVKVSADPEYKDLVLGATSLDLSDEVLTSFSSLTNGEDEVTNDTVKLSWKDQNGVPHAFDLSGATVNTDKDEITLEGTGAKDGDKLVISSANTNGAFEIGVYGTDLEVSAQKDKETNNASIRVSYYADKTANKPTTQKKIATTVADIDPSKPAADYETLVDNSAIDPNTVDTATVTAYAVDKDGNRVGNVTEEITLTADPSVQKSVVNSWFDIGTTADNKVTFNPNSEYFMTETGAIKVNYTVADASDPHGTVTLNYDNSFKAPDKVSVNTKPAMVDFSDDLYGDQISVNSLLFGKINGVNAATNDDSADLVIDKDSTIYSGNANSSSIAIKNSKTGYTNNPILSVLGKDGKTIDSGAALYGLNLGQGSITGNGYVVDKTSGSYLAGTDFNVKYSISNAKNLEQSSTGDLGNKLSVKAGEDQASFTLVVTEVTTDGDPRMDNSNSHARKNLLDAPKSIDVILKAGN